MPLGIGLAGGRMGLGLAQGGGTVAVPWYQAGGAPTPVAAYQAKGAASLAASYSNLANPGTCDAAPGVAPTWDAIGGWTFAGAAWLTTGVNIAVVEQVYSVAIRFSDYTTGSLGGIRQTSSSKFQIIANTGTAVQYGHWQQVTVTPGLAAGVLAIAGANGYRNGTSEATMTGSAAFDGRHFAIGGTKNGASSVENLLSAKVQAFAIWSSTLTGPQVAAVSAAMAAL